MVVFINCRCVSTVRSTNPAKAPFVDTRMTKIYGNHTFIQYDISVPDSFRSIIVFILEVFVRIAVKDSNLSLYLAKFVINNSSPTLNCITTIVHNTYTK